MQSINIHCMLFQGVFCSNLQYAFYCAQVIDYNYSSVESSHSMLPDPGPTHDGSHFSAETSWAIAIINVSGLENLALSIGLLGASLPVRSTSRFCILVSRLKAILLRSIVMSLMGLPTSPDHLKQSPAMKKGSSWIPVGRLTNHVSLQALSLLANSFPEAQLSGSIAPSWSCRSCAVCYKSQRFPDEEPDARAEDSLWWLSRRSWIWQCEGWLLRAFTHRYARILFFLQ